VVDQGRLEPAPEYVLSAVTSAAAITAAALAVVGPAFVIAPILVTLCTSLVMFATQGRRRIDGDRELSVVVLGRHVEHSRRLAIFDPETGLLAEWYVSARIAEECERARSFGSVFAVTAVQVDRADTSEDREDALVEWMRSKTRATDIAGNVGGGRYLLLLPNTSGEQATELLKRMQEICPSRGAVAVYARDGVTVAELLQRVEECLTATPHEVRLSAT